MELNEFITNTLEEIAKGVSGAKPKFEEFGGKINPKIQSRIHSGNTTDSKSDVEFEVSLTDTSTDTKGKGIGVLLSVISAGANKTNETEIRSMTKIKFNVPVELP